MRDPKELRNRLIQFTIDILDLTKKLPRSVETEIFSKQVIRSASSIGANYSEAMFAHSKIEFIHCINISRKESSETLYWLEVIKKANPLHAGKIDVLIEETIALLKIFVSSIKTAKSNIKNGQ